jgi:hypothetical protein
VVVEWSDQNKASARALLFSWHAPPFSFSMASFDEEQKGPECKTYGKSYGSNGDLNKHLKLQSQKSEEERGKHPAAGSKKIQKADQTPVTTHDQRQRLKKRESQENQ